MTLLSFANKLSSWDAPSSIAWHEKLAHSAVDAISCYQQVAVDALLFHAIRACTADMHSCPCLHSLHQTCRLSVSDAAGIAELTCKGSMDVTVWPKCTLSGGSLERSSPCRLPQCKLHQLLMSVSASG